MTFVKEAALACLAVLTGFTKTKAISNKTDGPAKKALANLLYVGIAVALSELCVGFNRGLRRGRFVEL